LTSRPDEEDARVPVYEYECSNCGEKTQRLQRVGEDSSGKRCLTCRDGLLKKVFSTFGTTMGNAGACSPPERSRFR